MLTNEEFHAWCQVNAISPEIEAYIQRIRSSQPVRKVRSGISNICGRYPSMKMGRTIQFESQHVELWGIYEMERDEDVLEYYDQPTRLQLQYRARSGRNTTQWHTPDFFVIRRSSAGFEEWKKASAAQGLTVTMPERYVRCSTGGWQCPPGEKAAEVYGLSYRVRTDAELHPLYIQNLKFLQDFWIHEYPVAASQEAHVLACLSAAPGISVAQLLDASPDLPVDVIWALLTQNRVFTNLSAASLMQWDQVPLYLSAEEAEHDRNLSVSVAPPLPLFTRICFDGRLWEAEKQGETVVLRPEVGAPLAVSAPTLQHLFATDQAVEASEDTPSTMTKEAREILSHAGPTQIEKANQRLKTILLQGLRTVILDEAQHLIQEASGKQPKDQLNWIKSMATETGVVHVLIGTYELLPFCNLNGQMARRGSEFHFARCHIEDEQDCQAFCNAFSSLLKQIPLTIDHDALLQRWWYFFEGSIGCIGILKQWLIRALYRALREESPALTRAHLEKAALPDAKWERMRADAQSGEAEFEHATEHNSYLSDLASLATFVPAPPDSAPAPDNAPAPQANETRNQQTPKRKRRPGDPSPRRDQVGTAGADQAATQCSFSGSIQLEARRWLESNVQAVQCPRCGSVSKARLKEQAVVIAPIRNASRGRYAM